MSILTAYTPPLLVTYATCSSSGVITFLFKPPFAKPLFLGGITVTKSVVKDAAAIAGTARPGTGTSSGGHADLQANLDEYAHLRTYVPLAGKFTLEFQYEIKSLQIIEIICATAS
jgi:hypothetical protein